MKRNIVIFTLIFLFNQLYAMEGEPESKVLNPSNIIYDQVHTRVLMQEDVYPYFHKGENEYHCSMCAEKQQQIYIINRKKVILNAVRIFIKKQQKFLPIPGQILSLAQLELDFIDYKQEAENLRLLNAALRRENKKLRNQKKEFNNECLHCINKDRVILMLGREIANLYQSQWSLVEKDPDYYIKNFSDFKNMIRLYQTYVNLQEVNQELKTKLRYSFGSKTTIGQETQNNVTADALKNHQNISSHLNTNLRSHPYDCLKCPKKQQKVDKFNVKVMDLRQAFCDLKNKSKSTRDKSTLTLDNDNKYLEEIKKLEAMNVELRLRYIRLKFLNERLYSPCIECESKEQITLSLRSEIVKLYQSEFNLRTNNKTSKLTENDRNLEEMVRLYQINYKLQQRNHRLKEDLRSYFQISTQEMQMTQGYSTVDQWGNYGGVQNNYYYSQAQRTPQVQGPMMTYPTTPYNQVSNASYNFGTYSSGRVECHLMQQGGLTIPVYYCIPDYFGH